jgi:ABC-2 type transport system permease protein
MTGLGSISRAILLAYRRDRAAVFFTIGFPLMFLVLFGGLFKGAATSKINIIQIGQVSLLDSLDGPTKAQVDQILHITPMTDLAAAQEKVRKGDDEAVIAQNGTEVQVWYSAADQVRAATVQGVVNNLVLATAGQPKVSLQSQQVEDKSLKSIQYYTPGLLGWALAAGGTAGAALTLVGWRKKQLLRRLRLSPVNTATVLTARLLVSIGIGLAQMVIFLAVASIPYFGLKFSGAWWMAVPLVIAGTFAFLSLGLLIGAFAKTEDSAQGIVQLIVLPMAFLSGSFFPLDGAPPWLVAVSKVMPLRYLVDSMRDVMVRGKGPASVLPTIAALLVSGLLVSFVATRFFRWDDV